MVDACLKHLAAAEEAVIPPLYKLTYLHVTICSGIYSIVPSAKATELIPWILPNSTEIQFFLVLSTC